MIENLKRKIKNRLGVPSVSSSLQLAHKNGFTPKVIFDIGAFEGIWTKEIVQVFPSSSFYMFEAQESKKEILDHISKTLPAKVDFHLGLLGAITGKEVVFYEYETASSVCKEFYDTGAKQKTLYLQALDEVVENRRWPSPDLIKLDTQGYELEILKGGNKALKAAEAVIMEVSLLEIYKGAPLIEDVIAQMSNWGFQVYDICSLMRRPLDNALYQTDLLFVRKDSNLVSSRRWV
ncbi:FkbM family methyltransferase [Pontibacter sp. CAU 1760]